MKGLESVIKPASFVQGVITKGYCERCNFSIASISIIRPNDIVLDGLSICDDCYLDMLDDGELDNDIGKYLLITCINQQIKEWAKRKLSERLCGE